jgi:hypothetical protein
MARDTEKRFVVCIANDSYEEYLHPENPRPRF